MIEISTKVIKSLGFIIFKKPAIVILSEYLDDNDSKLSICQQISPIMKFLVFINTARNNVINEKNVNDYIIELSKKTYSTAYNSRNYINQFLIYLNKKGYCSQINVAKIVYNKSSKNDSELNNKNTSRTESKEEGYKTYKYYEVFGISINANIDEIKKAYHKLARKYHPDVNKSSNADKSFNSINMIYKVLTDKNDRFEYDVTMGYISGVSPWRNKSDYIVII